MWEFNSIRNIQEPFLIPIHCLWLLSIVQYLKINNYVWNCRTAVYDNSFAHTKVRENILQNIVRGDFAGDGAYVVDGQADIFAHKIGRDAAM